MRAPSFLLALPALLALSLSAAAQTAPPPAAGETELAVPGDRYSQQIERIEVEDSNARIDELRVGGQTQSITVQPKVGAPRYEVQPANPATDQIQERDRGPGSAGRRTWKILDF